MLCGTSIRSAPSRRCVDPLCDCEADEAPMPELDLIDEDELEFAPNTDTITESAEEQAEAAKVQEEERLKAERARIATEEEVKIAEENKDRQIIVAQKNKERTEAVEIERVEKDRMLELTERERIVGLADIEKEKANEVEKRNIQDVIRERVMVERAVVEEQERIKDTEQFAQADRLKQVTVTKAEMSAEELLVMEVKAAEAARSAATLQAEQLVVEAEARRSAAEKDTQATKMLAEATVAEQAAPGLAEAHIQEAKADALAGDAIFWCFGGPAPFGTTT